jgi:hypothetical protein
VLTDVHVSVTVTPELDVEGQCTDRPVVVENDVTPALSDAVVGGAVVATVVAFVVGTGTRLDDVEPPGVPTWVPGAVVGGAVSADDATVGTAVVCSAVVDVAGEDCDDLVACVVG